MLYLTVLVLLYYLEGATFLQLKLSSFLHVFYRLCVFVLLVSLPNHSMDNDEALVNDLVRFGYPNINIPNKCALACLCKKLTILS